MRSVLLLWLWWLVAVPMAAQAAPTVVVLDNGEFNLPLYTPRWSGTFEQPSVAQQVLADLSRVNGELPEVYTYLPPGRVEQRSGIHRVHGVQPGCNPQRAPSDACACEPGERCWNGVDVNFHPQSSTSLVLAAAAARREVPTDRVEVHFTDFFEEDPSAAVDRAQSDRCVTRQGTRKAIEAILATQPPPKFVAVGKLSAQVAMPPPGGTHGTVYAQTPLEGSECWSGQPIRQMKGPGEPLPFEMGVIIAGFGDVQEGFRRLVAAAPRQISEPLKLELVVVRSDMGAETLPAAAGTSSELARLIVPADRDSVSMVPCDVPTVEATFRLEQQPLRALAAARCDGQVNLSITERDLGRGFNRHAGIDPRVSTGRVTGRVKAMSTAAPVEAALAAVKPLDGGRRLAFWDALPEAVGLHRTDGVFAPWQREVVVVGIDLDDLDSRPWYNLLFLSLCVGVLGGGTSMAGLKRWHARRAYERYLATSVSVARPIADVLEMARAEVDQAWTTRLGIGLVVGLISFVVCYFAMLLWAVYLV